MNEQIDTLRLEIDGRWSVEEMAKSLTHLRDLYSLRLVIQLVYEDWKDWDSYYKEFFPPFSSRMRGVTRRLRGQSRFGYSPMMGGTSALDPSNLSEISELLYPQEQLMIQRIEYGSPGVADIGGLGVIVGHVKDLILKLIERRDSKRQRHLENEERELRNQQYRIENANRLVQLARECGYSEPQMRSIVKFVDERQQTFIDLVDAGKIKSISLPSESDRTRRKRRPPSK